MVFQVVYFWDVGQGVKQLCGWFIIQFKIVEYLFGVGCVVNIVIWCIGGFMVLDSSQGSELVFDELIEVMCCVYCNDEMLGGLVQFGLIGEIMGIQKLDNCFVMFVGVFCYVVVLQFMIYVYFNFGE